MRAVVKDFYDPNRQLLHKIVPLDTPFTIQVEASSACDLRCKFCALSSENAMKQRKHVMKNMSTETFSLIIEQLKEFPQRLKRLSFAGLGEVLMNPHLPNMVREAKISGVAREVTLSTNAVKLTRETSLALVSAGLDFITISVNGLNAEDYERNCGRRIDYKKYVEQIEFLYKNKRDLRINIKTVDLCINNETDKKFFFDTFGNICDFINIETIAELHTGVDYSDDNIKSKQSISRHNSVTTKRAVCTFPFFRMSVSSGERVNFCDPVFGYPYDDCDVNKQKLAEMWNGSTHKQVMLNSLRGLNEGVSTFCENCTGRHACTFEEDNLDPYAEDLYKRINEG